MKKLLLTLMASVFCLTGARAEETTTLVATLSHEGSLKPFYGKEALKEAYAVARDGDIITLSAGTFTALPMNKNIVIRGVGMIADASSDNTQTILTENLTVQLKDNEYEFVLEGVWCDGSVEFTFKSDENKQKGVTLSKCGFAKYCTLGPTVYGKLNSCVSAGNGGWDHIQLYQGYCENCAFRVIGDAQGDTPSVFRNCVITLYESHPSSSWYYSRFYSDSSFTNCLIIGDGSLSFDSNNAVHSCVGFCTNANNIDFFKNVTNSSNRMVTDRENFFKDSSLLTKTTDDYGDLTSYGVKWSPLSFDGTGLYELSDEAKEIYKGNDGTVVGVWGGATPFNMTPSNPRITKCEIVPKVDSEGKLKVTIEVAQ